MIAVPAAITIASGNVMRSIPAGKAEALRVTIHDSARAFRMKLAGPFTDGDVFEIESCWQTAASTFAGRKFEVDLSGVTSMEPGGRELLARMHLAGGQFIGRMPETASARRRGRAFPISWAVSAMIAACIVIAVLKAWAFTAP